MSDKVAIYGIAGLKVKFEGAGENLKNRMSEYMLPLPKEGEHTCDIGVFINRTPDEITLPDNFKEMDSDHSLWNLFETDEFKGLYRYLEKIPDCLGTRMDLYENSAKLTLLSLKEEDAVVREYAYSGFAMAQLLLKHKRMVLHSSCISVDGQAILFSAPSGTGKSTHTQLWQEYVGGVSYINDDTPILRFDKSDEVYACGSPWSGKTTLNSNVSVPLKAIVFLERGTENSIEKIGGAEAFARLVGEARKLPFKDAVELSAELCGELIKKVPIYKLKCNISKEAVDLVKATVFND